MNKLVFQAVVVIGGVLWGLHDLPEAALGARGLVIADLDTAQDKRKRGQDKNVEDAQDGQHIGELHLAVARDKVARRFADLSDARTAPHRWISHHAQEHTDR